METPLLLASSNGVMTVPCAGQMKPISSPPAAGGCAGGAAGIGVGGAASVRGRAVTPELATGLVDGAVGAAMGGGVVTTAVTGGNTRSTWPTSIELAFARLFQFWMSRQFWPLSRAIRYRVSPAFTV